MRDIKFRGKRKDNNEWVTGCLLIENPPLECFSSKPKEKDKYLIGKSGFADWNMPRPFTAAEVYEESVGQFVGSKDKNGKEIFEGDNAQYFNRKGIIIYDERENAFALYSKDDKVFVQLLSTVAKDIEIIKLA